MNTNGSWLPQASGIVMMQANQLSSHELSIEELSVRRLTTLYFVACNLYYEHDISLFSDNMFDKLCVMLSGKKFGSDIYNKPSTEDLEAGTGFSIKYSKAILEISNFIRGKL